MATKAKQKQSNAGGWKQREAVRSKFWAPGQPEDDRLVVALQIEGTIAKVRTIAKLGKFGKQGDTEEVVDVETSEHGPVTVRMRGNLPQLFYGLGAGEIVRVRYLRKIAPRKGLPQGMHEYRLDVWEGESQIPEVE